MLLLACLRGAEAAERGLRGAGCVNSAAAPGLTLLLARGAVPSLPPHTHTCRCCCTLTSKLHALVKRRRRQSLVFSSRGHSFFRVHRGLAPPLPGPLLRLARARVCVVCGGGEGGGIAVGLLRACSTGMPRVMIASLLKALPPHDTHTKSFLSFMPRDAALASDVTQKVGVQQPASRF